MPALTPADWDALTSNLKQPSGFINYATLCDDVEKIFTTKDLYQLPDAVPPPPGEGLDK